jgi:hypothetical protein
MLAMNAQTFRYWLSEHGCTFEDTARKRGEGHTSVIVRRGPRRSELPNTSSQMDLQEEEVRRIMDELDLPFDELPGPQSRV